MTMTDPLALLAAFTLGVIGLARATRLVVHDNWPPAEALRLRWKTWCAQTQRRGQWVDLLDCPFCFAPYPGAAALAVAIAAGVWSPDLGSLAGWWWVLVVWAAGSYLAAILVASDFG
jgi:hypothetical protein